MQYHPYAVILALSFLGTLIVFIMAWRRFAPGSVALRGMLAGMLIWGGYYALTWIFTSPELKLLCLKIMYIGVVMVPGMFFVFVLRITQRDSWVTPRNLVLLCIEPLIVLTLAWWVPDRFFAEINPAIRNGYQIIEIERGFGFWMNVVYSYSLILLGMLLILSTYRSANTFFKKQYLLILLSSLIPFASSFYSQTKNFAFSDMDLTPVSFGISGMVYAFAIFRYQFMALVPVARSQLIENMSDGVLVLDAQGRIVDINKAMRTFLDEDPIPYIGRNVSELLKFWNDSIELLLSGSETRTEIKLPRKPPRYLDLRVTPLLDEEGVLSGRLIIFRDVSDRKEVEKDLRNAMDKLRMQLVEIHGLQEQLREQAIRDPLTNLFNRRYLEETLDRELARAARENYPLCVVMMDIDHFKDVNDTYGHDAGDTVLKKLSDVIMEQSRQGDFVCRYGGEELVLVMPNISIETTRERANNMLRAIQSLMVPFGRFNLNVTVSVGISWFPMDGATPEMLMRAADRALYAAKGAGRNQVLVYRELN